MIVSGEGRLEEIYRNLALWLGEDMAKVRECITSKEVDIFREGLRLKDYSKNEQRLRLLIQPFMGKMSPKTRYFLGTILKKLKTLGHKRDREERDLVLMNYLEKIKIDLMADGINWKGKRTAVCLTHDVDFLEGYRFIPELVRLEKEFGFRSSFNLLGNGGYKCDQESIQQLISEGFEIGLHGYYHDIALGYRDRRTMEWHIQKALEALPFPIKGFRAPALAVSESLLTVLNDMGFHYDSSARVASSFYPGVGVCLPYRYPGINLWEIPLAIQDDTLFRDFSLSEEEGLETVKGIIQKISSQGGVSVINTHPCLVRKRLRFYRGLLEFLSQQENCWVATLREISDFLGETPCLSIGSQTV